MYNSILEQVLDEYTLGYNYVRPKILQYIDRIKKRNPQNRSKDKINLDDIWNAIDWLIASSYKDQITVKFVPRDWLLFREQADNLNVMAEFDNQEDDYQQQYYQKEQDRYFFGVSVRQRAYRDDTRKIPVFQVINPLSWIPDPLPSQTGKFNGQNYRFHWFRMQRSMYDLINEKDGNGNKKFNTESLNKVIQTWFDWVSQEVKNAYADMWGYNYVTTDNLRHNFAVEVYYHYTIRNNRKTLVVTDWNMTNVLYQYELPATLKEEKEDPSQIRRPVILNYWNPKRNDPYGESICDRLEDKQDARAILLNLNVIKAKKEALGWDFLVNSRLINQKDLLQPSTQDRYIQFDDKNGTVALQNVMWELPRSQIKADSFNIFNQLEAIENRGSWIDALQSWMVPDKSMTKAEAQQIQANANMKQIRNNRVNARWEKDFWFERWKAYQENFSSADKKIVLFRNNFEFQQIKIVKDKIFTKDMPFILVWQRDDLEAINEKSKQFMNMQLPMILQDPETPKVSKNIAKRLTYRYNWMTPNQINAIVPLDIRERKAKDYLFQLNMDITPKSIFNDPNADWFTYYIYLQKAEDTDAKLTIMPELERRMMEIPNVQWQAQWLNQMANTSANIQMSQASQWMWNNLVTRENPEQQPLMSNQ